MNTLRTSSFLVSALLCMAGSTGALGATAEEVEEAKREQALAEARQATAEADAAVAKAKLGSIDVSKLPKVTGEASKLNVEGNILAYDAVDRIAALIAEDVAGAVGSSTVVIYSEKEINAVLQSRAFRKNLDMLNGEMGKFFVPPLASDNADCKAPAVGGGGLGPLGSIDAALQVLTLFKVDKKYEGMDVTVDSFALATAVLAKLKARGGGKAIYPGTYTVGAFADASGDVFAKSAIVAGIDRLGDNQARIDLALSDIARRKESIKTRSADPKTVPKDCVAAFADSQVILDNLEARAKAMKARGEKFTTAATTVDEKTGASLLQMLAMSEAMARDHAGAFVLQLKPIAAGGTTLTKTSLFATSFRFSGGAIVSYLLVSGVDGTVVRSGTVPEYGGYVKPEHLQGYIAGNRMQRK
jgi:hypothetical protein